MTGAWATLIALTRIAPGQDVYSFGLNVETVYVDVSVTRAGDPVPGLRATDFEVEDDGVRRSVELVDLQKLPLTAFLVLDTSASVAGERIEQLREAARAFLDGLEAKDRAALITFSHEIQRVAEVTEDVRHLYEKLPVTPAEGGTAVQDALFSSLVLAEDAPGRPLVLLFTDGEDTTSWLSETKVLEVAKRSDALIHAVAVTESMLGVSSIRFAREMADRRRRMAFLREVTRVTGGRVWETSGTSNLKEVFARILLEMKSRYVLSFSPGGAPREGWHRLSVRVRTTGGDVRARPGYFVRRPSAASRNLDLRHDR